MSMINIPEEFMDIQMDSSEIVSHYVSYANATNEGNLSDAEIYLEIIKELIPKERKKYSRISPEIAKNLLEQIDGDNEMSMVENRYYHRLKEIAERQSAATILPNGLTLYNIVKSTITLLMLKALKVKIKEIEKSCEADEETIQNYLAYFEVAKIEYLTDSTYLEDLALGSNFDIDKIVPLTIDEIKTMFHLPNDDEIMQGILTGIILATENLDITEKDQQNNTEEDPTLTVVYTFMSMAELARIEVSVPLLTPKAYQELRTHILIKSSGNKSQTAGLVRKMLNIPKQGG